VRAEVVEAGGSANDVDDRVDRADLVKRDFVERDPMHLGLGLGEPAKHGSGQGFDPAVQARGHEQLVDRAVATIGLGGRDHYVEFGAADGSTPRALQLEREAREAERRHALLDDLKRHAEIDQRRDRHVAGDAAERVEIQNFPRASVSWEGHTVGFWRACQYYGATLSVRVSMTVLVVISAVFIRFVMMMVVVIMMVVVVVVMPVAVRKNPLAAHDRVADLCWVDNIRPTAIAAPKPLSMLTTVMPDAQLVSIPNNAVKPDSAVP